MRRLLILTALLSCIWFQLPAQVAVESKIDSIQIFIGQQTHINLSVTVKEGQKVCFPHYKPQQPLVQGIEVLSMSKPDTTELENDFLQISRRYTITSFDEKLYYLPPMTVTVDGKPYSGKNLALKVLTVPVDTIHPDKFYPPKDVLNNPFLWSEWAPLFLLSILVIVLCLLTLYLYMRLRSNKPIRFSVKAVKRLLPHQRAMNEIDRIKAERMVSSENQKEYYTLLTDTLRKYIQERFGFSAMEMTSSEIITHLRQLGDRQMLDELQSLFETADLVKFAKYSTLINENDLNLVHAIEFIRSTKQEAPLQEEKIAPQLSEADQQTLRMRLTLKWLIIVLGLAVLGISAYVAYQTYLLLV